MNAVVDGTATTIKDKPRARTRRPDVAPDPAAAPLVKMDTPLVPQQANATTLLQAITQAASNPAVDIEKMERLFAMHQKIVAQESEAAYNAAMARAQSKMHTIVNDRANDHTRSRYATRAAINKVIVPIYTAEGLSVEFDTETTNKDDPVPEHMTRIVARVAHAAGHHERKHIDLFPDDTGSQGKVNKTRVQAAGSTGEYACRYLLKRIFNLATGDEADDDGNGNGNGNGQRTDDNGGQQRGEQVKTPAGKPPYPNEKITAEGLATWRGLVTDGRSTPDQIIQVIQSKYTLAAEQEKRIRTAITPKGEPQ